MTGRHARRTPSAESGVIAVWTALTLVLLLGTVALAVDVSYFFHQATVAQNASDAAALGGAAFLPDDMDTAASEALDLIETNGFDGEVSVLRGDRDNRLQVTVQRDVPTLFGRVLGRSSLKVIRKSTAEYLQPLGIGNPGSTLGNDPEVGGTQPNYWVTVQGRAMAKHDGDRYGSNNCEDDPTDNDSPVWGCTGTATMTPNPEHVPGGYRFMVGIPTVPTGQDLVIEAFDPVTAATDPGCADTSAFPNAQELTQLQTWFADAATRYASGANSAGAAWCAGDADFAADPAGMAMPTTFEVSVPEPAVTSTRTPASDPPHAPCSRDGGSSRTVAIRNLRVQSVTVRVIDSTCAMSDLTTVAPGASASIASSDGVRYRVVEPSSNRLVDDFVVSQSTSTKSYQDGTPSPGNGPVRCSRTFGSYMLRSGTDRNGLTYGTVNELLDPTDGVHDVGGVRDSAAAEFAGAFRRWSTICRIPAAEVATGAYVLTARATSPTGAQSNGFSLRAAWVDPTTAARTTTGITIAAVGTIPIYVNLLGASSAELYLARIMDLHAGHRLRVELFDVGDVADSTTTIELLPPTGSSGTWACAATKLTGTGSEVAIGNDCAVAGIDRAGWNGAAARFIVDIPPDYSCGALLETDCWAKVRIAFSAGAVATDTTTWSATIAGDPIRLRN